MKILLILGVISGPYIMYLLVMSWNKFRLIFNILAILSSMIFGIIASLTVYQVIVDNKVFMTSIHAIFLNPLFLIVSAYMGLYVLFCLLKLTMKDLK